MLDSLNLSNPISLLIAIVIVIFMIMEVINGYRKGFLESGVRLVGSILIIIGAYILKNPFFKFDGLFRGVTALNIIVYEVIAFVIVLVALFIIFKIICLFTKLVDKLLSLIFFIGIPNKILGAILGFIEGIVILYFVIAVFKIGTNLLGYEMEPSLADVVVETPILKHVFGTTLDSLGEITGMAKEYEYTKDKDEFNQKVIDILLEYDLITKDNLETLIEDGKINNTESEGHVDDKEVE